MYKTRQLYCTWFLQALLILLKLAHRDNVCLLIYEIDKIWDRAVFEPRCSYARLGVITRFKKVADVRLRSCRREGGTTTCQAIACPVARLAIANFYVYGQS